MLSWSWPALAAVVVCALAAVSDLRTRLIPNWLTLPVLAFSLLGHAWQGGAVQGALSLAAALVCALPAYFLFARGALGGGDVKLFAALGALVGARLGLELELTAFVLVTLFALLRTAWNGQLFAMLLSSWRATLHLLAPGRFPPPQGTLAAGELPMGGAIFIAALAALVRGSP